MNKIKNKIVILSAAVACCSFAFGGALTLQDDAEIIVNAGTQATTLDAVTFVMDKGASVRKDTPTGLRFRSLLSVEDYNALEANTATYQQISYGMVIAPVEYLVTYGALNEDNIFGEDAIYGWESNDGESFGGDVQIINVSSNSMVDFENDAGDTMKAFMGVITNLKGVNYARDFVGVGYIAATDKSGDTEYKFAEMNDNVRNVSYVAQKALLAGESDNNSALNGFVKNAYLTDIIASTTNVKEARPIDYTTGSASFTASANNMYISLDGDAIDGYAAGYDYLRLKLKSTTMAEFKIITQDSAGTENWGYVYKTLNGSEEFMIPLNDKSVHDFSQYNLRLYAASAGQNVTIESIDFVKVEDEEALNCFLDLNNWDEANIARKSATATSVTVGGWQMGINKNALKAISDLGYKSITATLVASYRATKIMFEQYNVTYESGERVTLSLADWNGIVRAANDSGICDGNVTFTDIKFEKTTVEDAALSSLLTASNWSATDGGSVHVDSTTANSIAVGGWYFKLSADVIQQWIDLGFSKISFKATGKWYGGNTPTHFYFSQTSKWYASGDTITLNLADYIGKGIKIRLACGGAAEGYYNDGSMIIDNIEFIKATEEDVAIATFVNSSNWVATDGGTVHVNETASNKIVVGGWYFKLTANAVQELIALGYSDVSFTIVSRGYGGSATHFYFAVTEEWYEPGATVTLNLEAHKEKGIKIRPATGAASASNFSDGAVQIENIVFSGREETPEGQSAVQFSSGAGYTFNGESYYTVGEDYSFKVAIADGYDATSMQVYANGTRLYLQNGKYVVSNAPANLSIKVFGVKEAEYSVILPKSDLYTECGIEEVAYRGATTLTITPTGAGVLSVKFNGVMLDMSGNNAYVIENITSNTVLEVSKYTKALIEGTAIVIPTDASDTVVYAAEELNYFVNEMTGQTLPIVKLDKAEDKAYTNNIFVGMQSTALASALPTTADSLAILADGNDVYIGGTTDRGTLYGVYEYLERKGVKFLTTDYTHIPTDENMAFTVTENVVKEPQFAYSAYYTGATSNVASLASVKYNSRMRFVHQFTGESMDSIYYAPSAGNDEYIYGVNGTLSTIEATQTRMDWFTNGFIVSSHNSLAYMALGIYAMRDSIPDWSKMIEFGFATDAWHWCEDSTPDTIDTTMSGYVAQHVKPLVEGEIAYESIRLNKTYIQSKYSGILYSNGTDLCYSSGVLKNTGDTVTALSLVKAGMDYAMTTWGDTNTYFMFGFSDQENRCTCATCSETKSTWSSTYKYNNTYYYYKFVQALASDMLTKHPDKKVVMWAYAASGEVPMQTSTAISADTIGKLPSNVYVQWAPIHMDEAYAYNDTTSSGARGGVAKQAENWRSYVHNDQFMLWGYENFYLVYADTLSIMAENIEYLKSIGYLSYMVQASNQGSNLPEMSMKSYVFSKAVWYQGTVTDALVTEWRNEFIRYYYGEQAYDLVVRYYDEMNAAYKSTFIEGYQVVDSYGNIWRLGEATSSVGGVATMIPADTLKTLVGYLNSAIENVGANSEYAEHLELLKLSPRYMYTHVYGNDYTGVIGTRGQLKADMLAAGVHYVKEGVTTNKYFENVEADLVIDDPALALVINQGNWVATDGGSIHIDNMTKESITVGGWYFKLTGEAVQGLIDLGYDEMSFDMTIKGYGGSIATDFYNSQAGVWYKSGDTVTLTLADYVNTGIKFRPATGAAAEAYFSDGSMLLENITFTVAQPIPDAEAFALITNAENWSETDGGTVHVDATTKTTVQVGGWFFKLNADVVEELLALGYTEMTFTATSARTATYFYLSQTKEWYPAGSTITINLNLAAYVGTGIKIRPTTGMSEDKACDGSLLMENIVFTKAEDKPSAKAMALVVDSANWSATDGGTVRVDSTTGTSIQVGGWFFKLNADVVQQLIDLGYDEMTFTATTARSATHFYMSQTGNWYASGATVKVILADYVGKGIKIRTANGGTSDAYFNDGAILMENIVFSKETPNPDAEAFALITNAENWSETDAGTVHVDATTKTTVQVGGWFFKLNANVVEELLALGYTEMSFTATSARTATYFYLSQTKEWYPAGSTITINLNLAAYVGTGIKIRPTTGMSENNACDGSILLENIVFTKAENNRAPKAVALMVNEANWSATDGGSVHVDEATSTSIAVGGWYFKLNADVIQQWAELGFTTVSFKVTGKWYGGNTPTHFYFSQTSKWYASDATVTLNIADYLENGLKIQVGNGTTTGDGSMIISDIVFA